jgi:hypothetical protein
MARKQSKVEPVIKKKKILNHDRAVEVFENPDNGYDTMLTPELIKRASQLYQLGVQDNAIANSLGVGINTFREWLQKGLSFDRGLHGELFRACAKAVGNGEIQFMLELRKHAFGAEAEYFEEPMTEPAKDENGNILWINKEEKIPYTNIVKDHEGKPVMRIARDKEGKALIKKEAIRGSSQVLQWMMERRDKKTWGRQEKIDLHESTQEQGVFDTPLHNQSESSGDENQMTILSTEDEIKVYEAMITAKKLRLENES